MKTSILSVLLFTSQWSLAAIEFQPNSKLPIEMQARVERAVAQACPAETRQGFRISENITDVNTLKIDQGMYDFFYSTSFSVHGTDVDGYHPRVVPVVVESALYSIQNGDPKNVRLVYGCEGSNVDLQCVVHQLQDHPQSVLSAADAHQVLLHAEDPRHEAVVQTAINCKLK